MPNLELPPKDVEQLRLREPLACPRCRAERGHRNYNLSVIDRGAGRAVLAWVVCTLRHRAAHRWYPRYLGGYGTCSICGREWG